MNMTITDNDRKLLGLLAAFLVAAAFLFFVFQPLAAKNEQLEAELKAARTEEADIDNKAALAGDMKQKEQAVTEQMKQVLARFYPVMQSQEAERMVTTLMLNHNLDIQSLTVIMPEKAADLDWYQYSQSAASYGQPAEGEEKQIALPLYVAKVTCVTEGKKEDLWSLVDDISTGYPAISISSIEWSSTERVTGNNAAASAEGDVQVMPATVKTDRLTIGLEIYMCNQ